MSEQPVLAAVEMLADPIVNARFRTAIQQLELPTWERFVDDVEQWIGRRLAASGARLVA